MLLSQPWQRSPVPQTGAEEWPCYQPAFALTPTTPKNGHRINFWRLASIHQCSCSTLEAQGTCASSNSEELWGEKKPYWAFFLFPNDSGSEAKRSDPLLCWLQHGQTKLGGGCKSHVMLHDAFLLTELLMATVNKSVRPALHPK